MKVRHLKIYEAPGSKHNIPRILLQGQWLNNLGFSIGKSIEISYQNGNLIIKIPDNVNPN